MDAVQVFTRAFTSILDSDKTFLHEALTSGGNKVIKCTDESEVKSGFGARILQEMKKVCACVCVLESEKACMRVSV